MLSKLLIAAIVIRLKMSNSDRVLDIPSLKLEQIEKSHQVIEYDDFDPNITLIGGTDVGFEKNGEITRAAIVVLRFPELTLLEYQIARLPTSFPYIPGYLSFREYPALVEAWKKIENKPSLLMVDGQGIAHPRGLGIASHLGILLNIPTIGVAKNRLYGTHDTLSEEVGSGISLMANQKKIGTVLRSKQRCKPLYISTGHRISTHTATQWVRQCLRGYRLPEPTRWADAVASGKPLFVRWFDAQQNVKK